jgi:RHS repeat-associated protein
MPCICSPRSALDCSSEQKPQWLRQQHARQAHLVTCTPARDNRLAVAPRVAVAAQSDSGQRIGRDRASGGHPHVDFDLQAGCAEARGGRVRQYGPAGQLLEAIDARGTTHYAYDAEGNLVRKTEPDGKAWHYRWNLTGMLVAVERPDGERVEFGYDPLARRVFKTYRGKTTRWIWDGNVPLHEWVELNEEALAREGAPLTTSFEREIAVAKRRALLARRSAQGPPRDAQYVAAFGNDSLARESESDVPLLKGTPDSPITWLFEPESFAPLAKLVADERDSMITDHLGTPRAMFDALGHEAWSADIDTYGQLRDVRGPRDACPFRVPGQYEDEETGLYYNRFRYYDPDAGGYVSQDQIGLVGGLRLHA